MRANRMKSLEGKILILVAMTTLVVMAMGVRVDKIQDQHQRETEDSNSTAVGISVNETGTNLTLDFDFNSGDLAFERERTNHELTMAIDRSSSYNFLRFVECRGENIKSLSAISCHSMEHCEENKSLLFDESNCKGNSGVKCGQKCTSDGSGSSYHHPYGSSYSNDEHDDILDQSRSSCLRIQVFIYSLASAGIVQCTSEVNGLNVTTLDHYSVDYLDATFFSASRNKSDLMRMKLHVSSLIEDLNGNSNSSKSDQNSNANANVTLFMGEEVTSLECKVPRTLFHYGALIIRAHMEDGSTVKLDSKRTSTYYDGFMKAEVTDFRVPADIIAFSCSAQRNNSSGEWLENRINIIAQALPSQVVVKKSESRNMTVNLTSGTKVILDCQVTGAVSVKASIRDKMRKMKYKYHEEASASSTSVVEFLRFYKVAGENLICHKLDSGAKNSAQLTPTSAVRYSSYRYEKPFHFLFKLAPSAPKIHNPNPNNQSSSVHLIYHEDHVVDQTLLCLFNGNPEPVITWIKNGHQFQSVKSVGIRELGNETLEHVKLRLDSTTIQPTDFETGNGKSGHVNFSCVASNCFGSDRLDFIITLTGEFEFPHPSATASTRTTISEIPTPPTNKISISSAQSKRDENSHSNLDQLGTAEKSKTILFVTIFFLLSFIFILGVPILWKKRTVFYRAVENRRILTFRNLVENDRTDLIQ